MSITRRLVTFNVNQFDPLAQQTADIEARMGNADVVLLQECLHLDVVAFAKAHPGWAAFQIRHGSNDGHANTAVLHRTSVGTVTDTICTFLGSAADTRRRYLTAVEFDHTEWDGAVHIFPRRDTRAIPAELKALATWVKAQTGKHITLGLDRNQCTPAELEKATGLSWHGVDIDGFLSNVPVSEVAAFKPGHSDHPGVHGVATLPARVKPKHRKVAPPNPPYVGPADKVMHNPDGSPWTDNLTPSLDRIVIHSTVSPCVLGGARQIARYFNGPTAGGSAHYVVDPGEVVQDVYDSWVAEHAPPNPNSIGIEMCDMPVSNPTDVSRRSAKWKSLLRASRWRDAPHQQMLARTAKLTARLCAAYHVPPVFVTAADLRAGKHGITTHNEVSVAWRESDHWDPGFWPRRKFMRLVRAEYARLTA